MAQVPLPTPTDNDVPSTDIRDAVYAGAMLDKVVTSTDLTYTARNGSVHYTVDGIKAEADAIVKEAQDSITILGLPFATLSDAQAAVDAEKIPDGAVTWVRNDDASLADEYINNGGTLSATGRKMPSQEYIDDGFTPGRVVESDTDVAIAVTFADGSRSWLESGFDGRPTEHSAQMIGEAIQVGDSPVSSEQVAIATLFADGSRSWLESGFDGRPTEHSAQMILDVISGAISASETQTIALSTAPDGTGREYPTFERLNTPIIQFSQQSAETIYWPWIVDKSAWGGSGFALFYSTDHSATHDPSGIFLFESDDITGPWINRGKVFRDDTGGWQSETPSVIYDSATNKVLMYYQQAEVPGSIGQQQTCLAIADPADLTIWTRVGVVLDKEFAEQPGDGHCGYFRPFKFNGRMLGYSLYGGTLFSNASLWVSDDGGYTWQRDGRLIGWMQDKCRHLADILKVEQHLVVLTMYEGDVINWKGEPWWVGVVGKAQSGSVSIRNYRLVTAPLASDFGSLLTRVNDITPAPAHYEIQTDIDYPGNCVVSHGRLYMVYRTGGQKGDIALMRLK
ncbi:hypothetical protein [Klebsiella pneumoniae]|uniref:hypothetical protein n=1 Tax=Klebsiella pneumoniae TaxID=573 RepID=UPI002D79B56C|nr:hypothetical protein [Klebsiella pneumoniae]WRP51150.1 hypothetical protein VI614_15675 [Klebsiella pneumoniae]